MARHLFFGANTPDGFYQCFSDILFFEDAQKIIYLKGSSGSGKSTLMRKVAAAFETRGSKVDYIHCSNAANDLDGICVRDYGVSMVDATAPHVCDPMFPIALDEILNLADYINADLVKPYAGKLMELQKRKKPYYEKAYRYLNAAYRIYENNASIYQSALNAYQLSQCISKECAMLSEKSYGKKPGRNRRMFSSAITPQGYTHYLDTLLDGYQIVRVAGELGMGFDTLLARLQTCANAHGLDTETCYLPFAPQKAEHLFLPALGICYLSGHEYAPALPQADRTINLYKICDAQYLQAHEEELKYNRKSFDTLLTRSMEMMAAQKEVHDAVEKIYVPSMDFAGLDTCADSLIAKLTQLSPIYK